MVGVCTCMGDHPLEGYNFLNEKPSENYGNPKQVYHTMVVAPESVVRWPQIMD